jgi:4-oxalocrotonate tautomerase
MPILTLKLSAAPASDITARAAAAVAELTARILRKKVELIAVTVEALPPEAWFIGGRSLQAWKKSSFYLDIKVTQSTNTKDEKALFVAEVFTAMRALLGELHEVSYVVVHEVPADAWGFAGASQENRYIAAKGAL